MCEPLIAPDAEVDVNDEIADRELAEVADGGLLGEAARGIDVRGDALTKDLLTCDQADAEHL